MSEYTRDDLRRPAVIKSVFRGKEDHGIETVVVHLEGPGWGQGFGCLAMKDSRESRQFVREVCDTFGLSDPERLKGQKCIALYSEPWGTIDGLEAPSGKRFTIRGWRKRHYPDNAPTPTEAKRESLKSSIAFHRRMAAEEAAKLASLKPMIDWEEEES